MNVSANITLYGITYTDPKPQYSLVGTTFTDCTVTSNPACSEISFSGTTYDFNVSHFTSFKSAEAYSASTTTTTSSSSSDNNDYVVSVSGTTGNITTVYGGLDVNIEYEGDIYVLYMDSETIGTTVDFTIEEIEYSMEEGDYLEIDLDGDGVADISIKVEDIRTPYADLIIKELTVVSTTQPDTTTSEIDESETDGEQEVIEQIDSSEGSLIWLWIGVSLIILIMLFIYFSSKKE